MATALVEGGVLEMKVAEAIRTAEGSPGYWELNRGTYPGTVEVDLSVRKTVLDYLTAHQQEYGRLPQIELTPALSTDRSRFSHILIEPTERQALKLAGDADKARLEGRGQLRYVGDILLDTCIGHLQ